MNNREKALFNKVSKVLLVLSNRVYKGAFTLKKDGDCKWQILTNMVEIDIRLLHQISEVFNTSQLVRLCIKASSDGTFYFEIYI